MKNRGFEVCKDYIDKDINLPVRKTKNSVGYDIEAAEDTVIPSIWKNIFGNFSKFVKGDKEYLEIKGLILANSLGIIESDYYENPDNDGHLMYAYYNFFPVDITIKKHDTIGQAYFQNFLKADNDRAEGVRTGGFGSTDKK